MEFLYNSNGRSAYQRISIGEGTDAYEAGAAFATMVINPMKPKPFQVFIARIKPNLPSKHSLAFWQLLCQSLREDSVDWKQPRCSVLVVFPRFVLLFPPPSLHALHNMMCFLLFRNPACCHYVATDHADLTHNSKLIPHALPTTMRAFRAVNENSVMRSL